MPVKPDQFQPDRSPQQIAEAVLAMPCAIPDEGRIATFEEFLEYTSDNLQCRIEDLQELADAEKTIGPERIAAGISQLQEEMRKTEALLNLLCAIRDGNKTPEGEEITILQNALRWLGELGQEAKSDIAFEAELKEERRSDPHNPTSTFIQHIRAEMPAEIATHMEAVASSRHAFTDQVSRIQGELIALNKSLGIGRSRPGRSPD